MRYTLAERTITTRTKDDLIHRQPLHNLLRIIQYKRRKQHDRKARNDQVHRRAERHKEVYERRGDDAPDAGKEERVEGREIESGLESEEGKAEKDAEGDEDCLKNLDCQLSSVTL